MPRKPRNGNTVIEVIAAPDAPLAAASIAQVHRATLWSGEEVVFKVRRPGIQEVVKQDIDILHRVADLIERYVPDLAFLNARGLVEEFQQVIQEEMDFLREAENASRFKANFEGSEELYVPKVFLHLTTEQVLVMEYLEGARIDDLQDDVGALDLVPGALDAEFFHQIAGFT